MPNDFDTSQYPLGSMHPYVLYNNAGNEDLVVNDVVNETWIDRPPFNRVRKTFYGMEQDFARLLAASGFELPAIPYASGVVIDRPSQLISYLGNVYSVNANQTFPYTLDGTFATDEPNLVLRSDQSLRTELGQGVRRVNSIADLRPLTGRFDGDLANVVGYHAAWNGHGSGVAWWDADSVEVDDGFSAFGAGAVGRWKWVNLAECTVFHAGAIPGAESSDAIQTVFNWVRARGWGTVNLGDGGFFLLNKPIRGCANSVVVGKTILRAQSPFSTVTFDIFGGGTLAAGPMIYYADAAPTSPSGTVATINNPTGSRRNNIRIEDSVTLDCDDIAGYGVFLDNYQYGMLAPRVIDATKWGIRCNFYNWTMHIPAKITGPAEGGLWLGPAANGINTDGLLVWGDTKIPSVAGVLVDGDNNGLSMCGMTIENVYDGVLLRSGFGPVEICGSDFEQIGRHCINADGVSVPSRVNGPVTANSNFMETLSATDALIKAYNSTVIAKGNRMRNASKIVDHASSGWVRLEANELAATVLSVGTGRIHNIRNSARALADEHYSTVSTSMESTRTLTNYAYPYAVLPSSGVSFSAQVTSGTNRTMTGIATMYVATFNLDVEVARMGFNLDYSTANPAITPINDNAQDLGTAARRHKVVYAGTGTINTSDAREKTGVRVLTASEIKAAMQLSKEIGAYKWLASVKEKGDSARDHIGLTVQKAIEIMNANGLEPFDYGFICHDIWSASPSQYDENGVQTYVGCAAGDRYSFRYDQLNLFIAAGFEARLSALESKM